MTTALVTGASVGIGAAFCRELARTGHHLVIVARSGPALEALAADLRSRYAVHVETLVADLSVRADVERVADRLRTDRFEHRAVDLLVNNAGFGLAEAFLDSDLAEEERALEVMVHAVLVLSHAAGRQMRDRGSGAIINVSSVAGFVSMSSYSAIKAWVTTFSEALATELRGSGVSVTALCPGFTRSQFHSRANLNMSKLPDFLWLDPDDLVKACLADARQGRVVSVPGPVYKVLTGAVRVLPRTVVRRASASVGTRRRGAGPGTGAGVDNLGR